MNLTMDGYLHKIGFFEKVFYFTAHKLVLGFLVLIFLVLQTTPLTPIENSGSNIIANPLEVDFSNFSPAFAALEDEYLLEDDETGLEDSTEKMATQDVLINLDQTKPVQLVKVSANNNTLKNLSIDSLSFDGSQTLLTTQNIKHQPLLAKTYANEENSFENNNELGSGSLAMLVDGGSPAKESSPVVQAISPVAAQQPTTDQQIDKNSNKIKLKEDETSTPSVPNTFQVSGNVSLKEGLAYFGDMDVAWVVGDQEFARGSVNTPDATYSIEVKDNVGDIVISLYDNKNELIGEGFVDLTQIKIIDNKAIADIDIRPINWDTAGRVVDASSIGLQEYGVYTLKTVKNTLIELYAFSEATETNSSGEFSFYNWKKSNSRSLALASKKGYKDSLFILDSKKELSVLLFSNEYIDSFFSYLRDIGLGNVANKGTVYGYILGANAQGFSVKLEKEKPIYFLKSGFANISQKTTSTNGQFAFVGLDNGEYELIVEKNNQIVDRKIVLVEENKISPVTIDLHAVSKYLEFFNPLNPKQKIDTLKASFFDGESEVKLHNNSTFINLNNSAQPSVLDFEGPGLNETSRTFISQNKGLQRIPLLQDESLLKLAESKNMNISKGLIIGFIDSPDAYHVSMKEAPVEQILYFDELGNEMSDKSKVAYGFIMSGFNKGLSSILVSRSSDDIILMTDIVFSDHESISIINSGITAVDN
jgi:hypothetical protein